MSKSESADSPMHIVRDGRTYKVFCGPTQLIVPLASGKHLPVEFLNREAAEGYVRWRRSLVAEEATQEKPTANR
jgi:hypothetical protein